MASSSTAVVSNVFLVQSPIVLPARDLSVKLIEARLGPASAKGRVERIACDEPGDLVARLSSLVDVDATHVTDPALKPFVRNLHVRQVSNTMKHAEALRRASSSASASTTQHRFSLVMEDDAVFGDTVLASLASTASSAPEDADLVFLGLPSNRGQSPGAVGVSFDDAGVMFPVLPACESYLITVKAATRMLDAMSPIRFPTNIQLSYAIRSLGLKTYVAVPNVFIDGSKLGVFTCTLDSNSRLIWNQQYCRIDALIRGVDPYADLEANRRLAEFERLWNEQPFKDHPDVLAQRGAFLAKTGQAPERARDSYQRAYDKYVGDNAIVNNTSDFLRSFIALYSRLQGTRAGP